MSTPCARSGGGDATSREAYRRRMLRDGRVVRWALLHALGEVRPEAAETLSFGGVASASDPVITVEDVRLLRDRSAAIVTLSFHCPAGAGGDARSVQVLQKDVLARASMVFVVPCPVEPTTVVLRTTYSVDGSLHPIRALLRATIEYTSCSRFLGCPPARPWLLETSVIIRPK